MTHKPAKGEVPWETEMAMNAFLCVLEEACHREIDEAGPWIAYNPEGAPFAVPLGERTMRNMFYRLREAMRKRYDTAHSWHEKIEKRVSEEHTAELARVRGEAFEEAAAILDEQSAAGFNADTIYKFLKDKARAATTEEQEGGEVNYYCETCRKRYPGLANHTCRPAPPQSLTVEEAAEKYANQSFPEPEVAYAMEQAFLAGASWQAAQQPPAPPRALVSGSTLEKSEPEVTTPRAPSEEGERGKMDKNPNIKEILEQAEELLRQITPLPWSFDANIPFYVDMKKPANSLSKHDEKRPTYWNYPDGLYASFAIHMLPILITEIKTLQQKLIKSEKEAKKED